MPELNIFGNLWKKNVHDVELILKLENPFAQFFNLYYSLRNTESQVDRRNRFVAYAFKLFGLHAVRCVMYVNMLFFFF